MRITAIDTRVVNAEMRNWVFVRVETDQSGLFGWGEATLEWKTRGVVGAVEDLKPLVLGRDPRDIEQAVRVMKKHSFWRLGVIGVSAISGIEIALWDIVGKALGVPVWRLLGGKVRDKVRVYTHLGMGDMRAVYETNDKGPLVERALEVIAKGYGAFKAVFIPYTHYTAPLPDVDKVASLMSALRAAVGPKVEIMVDFHGRPASAAAALAYIDALRPARPMFVEEPVPPGEIATLKAVAAHARGHRRQGAWRARLETAWGQSSRQGPGLHTSRNGRHARGVRNQRQGPPGRASAGGHREGVWGVQGGLHPLHALYGATAGRRQSGKPDVRLESRGRAKSRDHGRFSRTACERRRGAGVYRRFAPRAADVRRRTRPARRDRHSQSSRGAREDTAGYRRAAY